MAKKIYAVVTPVDFDNERYAPGDPIELDDKHAKPLLEVNAIAPEKVAGKKDADKK